MNGYFTGYHREARVCAAGAQRVFVKSRGSLLFWPARTCSFFADPGGESAYRQGRQVKRGFFFLPGLNVQISEPGGVCYQVLEACNGFFVCSFFY